VNHPISHSAQGGVSVIPLRRRDRYIDKPTRKVAS
jgi:hypothetical protein